MTEPEPSAPCTTPAAWQYASACSAPRVMDLWRVARGAGAGGGCWATQQGTRGATPAALQTAGPEAPIPQARRRSATPQRWRELKLAPPPVPAPHRSMRARSRSELSTAPNRRPRPMPEVCWAEG